MARTRDALAVLINFHKLTAGEIIFVWFQINNHTKSVIYIVRLVQIMSVLYSLGLIRPWTFRVSSARLMLKPSKLINGKGK